MNKSLPVVTFLLSCALVVGLLGCAEEQVPTTATTAESTTTALRAQWSQSYPSPEPSARAHHAMVCDPITGKVFLFGGLGGDVSSPEEFNDLWTYDPVAGEWTELSPGGGTPSARHGHAMVYDPVLGEIFVFGGQDADGQYLGDLWGYDLAANTWVECHPSGDTPDARCWSSLAYDEQHGKILLFAGTGGDLVPFGEEFTTNEGFNDLWSYDPQADTWTELLPTGSVPCARRECAMDYDPSTGEVILFGGFEEPSREPMPLVDLWTYDPASNVWTELSQGVTPEGRGGAAMVYDADCGLMVLFGGYAVESDSQFPATPWSYDSSLNGWEELGSSGSPPCGREGHAMVYDSKIGGIVMFGGFDPQAGYLGVTWTLTL